MGCLPIFFLKGIHSKNAYTNRDNKLTFDELYRYVSDNANGVPYYSRSINVVEQVPSIEGNYEGKVFLI